MQKVAQFYLVSASQFNADCQKLGINASQDGLVLPKRATTGSAGYDFYSPLSFTLAPGETLTVPTGVRVKIDEGYLLSVYPKSGLGFKYRLQLDNTVGIIDADYYYSDNEGHILVKITNCSTQGKSVTIEKGKAFCQGIFTQFFITYDDEVTEKRNGGFGSTQK